jgi:bacillithiol system protein YtxJ
MIKWTDLTSEEQLEHIVNDSFKVPQLIFKHSSRCSISAMALNRFERQWDIEIDSVSAFFLDLISYRKISNAVADKFNIIHESPQVLLIRNGKCIYDTSHNDISVWNFKDHLIPA